MAIADIRSHARRIRFPEYLEPMPAPRNNVVPAIEPIDRDRTAKYPKPLLISLILASFPNLFLAFLLSFF